MTVKAIKLISGEELLGEVFHEDETEILLKNVLAILMSRQQDGNLGIGFVPFAPYLGKDMTLEFKTSHLIFSKEVDDQMKNQYNSIFGGIITPPKTLLVG